MYTTFHTIRNTIKCFAALWCACLLYSCDTLEGDVAPLETPVSVDGTKIYTITNGSTLIDLQTMVKTNESVRLNVVSKPRKGSLAEIGTGLLQYSPNENFKKGRDGFAFSIFSHDNRLLKQDSIIIIVENDSTDLPCGVYPKNDFVYDSLQGAIDINVLHNDFICGDSSSIRVEIYRPHPTSPPYAGSAVVLSDNRIRYTPGSSFTGNDKIMYKVYTVSGDTSYVGIGTVYIKPAPLCQFYLNADIFQLKRDTVANDSIYLDVLSNDIFCPADSLHSYRYDIIQAPEHGTAFFERSMINYLLSDSVNTNVTDSLVYEVCKGQHCEVASVKIEIH